MSRRRTFKMPANGYDRCWAHFLWARAFPVGLTYCSLAINDSRYVSDETKLFAWEYYILFMIPGANILLLLFCALSDLRAQAEEMRPQSCWDDSWRCLHSHHLLQTLFQKLTAHWRWIRCLWGYMKLWATFSFQEIHWHVITNLALPCIHSHRR